MTSKYENLAIFIIFFSRTSHFRPIFTSVYEIQKNIKFVKIIVRVATLWSKINLKKLKSSDFLIFSLITANTYFDVQISNFWTKKSDYKIVTRNAKNHRAEFQRIAMWIGQSLTTPGLYLFCSHSYLLRVYCFLKCGNLLQVNAFLVDFYREHFILRWNITLQVIKKISRYFFLICVYWLNGSVLNLKTIELFRK